LRSAKSGNLSGVGCCGQACSKSIIGGRKPRPPHQSPDPVPGERPPGLHIVGRVQVHENHVDAGRRSLVQAIGRDSTKGEYLHQDITNLDKRGWMVLRIGAHGKARDIVTNHLPQPEGSP
jgi:hypothetical protein